VPEATLVGAAADDDDVLEADDDERTEVLDVVAARVDEDEERTDDDDEALSDVVGLTMRTTEVGAVVVGLATYGTVVVTCWPLVLA